MKINKKLTLLALACAIQSAYATIDVGSGTKTLVETDYSYQSNQPFSFSRYYSHAYKFWQFDFENTVSYSKYNNIEIITFFKANFQNTSFKKINDQWINVGKDKNITLSIDAQNNVILTRPNGDKEIYKNSSGQFNSATIFQLMKIEKKNGQFLNISYPSSYTKTLTDTYGNVYTVNYVNCVNNNGKTIGSFEGVGGKTIQYSYSSTCVLEKVTYPDNTFKKYTSSSSGITEIYDENNNIYQKTTYFNSSNTYQPGIKASSEGFGSDGMINKITLSYTVANKVTLKDSLNNSTVVNTIKNNGAFKVSGYDSICTTCKGIQGSQITYNAAGFIDTVTDFKNNISKYIWNSNGFITKLIEAYGTPIQRETNYEYDSSGTLLTSKKEPVSGGHKITTNTYVNNLISHISISAPSNKGDGSLITKEYTFIYDGEKIIEIRNPLYSENNNQKILISYNSRGQIQTTTNELGHVTQYSDYDDYGNPTKVIMQNGNVNLFTYDLRGRILSSTLKSNLTANDDETTHYTYDLAGQLIKLVNPSGSFSTFKYDTAHRLNIVEDWAKDESSPNGIFQGKVEFILDNMSNLQNIKVFDENNTLVRNSTHTYDSKNRLFKTIGSLNQTTTYTYDNNSNLTQVKDADNYNFLTNHDSLNRVIAMNNPDDRNIALSYNSNDSISTVNDPKGLDTKYKHDGFGNLIEKKSPDTGITKYTYDLKNNLKTEIDAKNQLTTYSYDALNRLISIGYSNALENASMTYDTCMIGKICSIQNENGTTQYTYNNKGRLVNKQLNQTINSSNFHKKFNKNVSYEYDNSGNTISITYPSGSKVEYEYFNDKIISIKYTDINNVQTNIISNIKYAPFESDSKSFNWNNSNLVSNNKNTNIDGIITQISNSQTNSYNKNYGYDNRFNITNISGIDNSPTNSKNSQIIYDSNSRVTNLTHVDVNNGSSNTESNSYTYNTSDDRTSHVNTLGNTTYSYDNDSHKLLELSGVKNDTLNYDLNGNLISNNENQFIYNSANRLAQSISTQYGTTTYSYNGYGQRVRKQTINGSDVKTNWFVYADSNLMYEEIQNNNNAPETIEYLYLNGAIIGLVQNNVIYYVQTDHLGTPRTITNSITGDVVWTWDNIEAFGNNEPIENGLKFNLRFPGQYHDSEKNTSYNINRDYSSSLGRYIQSDPIGLDGGMNTYGYVKGNPLTYTDPEGLAVDINMFGFYESLYGSAQKYKNDPNRFSIAGHGNPINGISSTEFFTALRLRKNYIYYSPEELAKLIKKHIKYKKGMPIDLLGCSTGEIRAEEIQFAQNLSNLLQASVRGPDNLLWFHPNGELSIYGKKIENGKGVMDLNIKGKYNEFYPK